MEKAQLAIIQSEKKMSPVLISIQECFLTRLLNTFSTKLSWKNTADSIQTFGIIMHFAGGFLTNLFKLINNVAHPSLNQFHYFRFDLLSFITYRRQNAEELPE